MNNSTAKRIVGFILACGFFTAIHAQQIVYITGTNKIGVITNPNNPSVVTGPFTITGLPAGQIIEAIDYRPLTGELFALGYNAATQEAQLYTINQTSATVTAIGVPNTLDLVPGRIGFDFNPTVDRIRVTGANGTNYRLHPGTGALVATDGALAYAGTDVNAGATANVASSSYTRSYIGSEITTLYNIDLGLGILTTQTPPNSGTLNTVGSLGLAFNAVNPTVGVDFFFDGNAGEEKGYISANTNTNLDSLYSLNITTGAATNLGQIGGGLAVRDIAVVVKRTIPPLTGLEAYALTGLGNLINFDTDNPSIVRSWMPITGITAGQVLLGIDFRPADGTLYALGYDRPFSQYQLYAVSINTGVAVPINATPIGIELDTAIVGFDFNPVADKIRVVGAHGENYRINPDNGSLAGVDAAINFGAGDIHFGQTPFISSLAYTNNYSGALETSLFVYDQNLNAFGAVANPILGTIHTVGNSGITTSTAALDIYYDLPSDQNKIFCAAGTTSSFAGLYTIDNTGAFTSVGSIGYGIPVKSLALPVANAPSTLDVSESGINAQIAVYPNPTTDILYLKMNNKIGQTFKITDMVGRTVMAEKTIAQNVESIDVTIFGVGVYFIVFEDETAIKWIKK